LGCRIDYISFESRPLPAAVMAQSHQAFADLAHHSHDLIAALPPQWPGLHRRDFLQGRLRLHLIYGDANDAVAKADFAADAWFLDGFSPSKNPDMWSDEIIEKIYDLEDSSRATCYKVTYSNDVVSFVPLDEANTDYQAIQEWISEGNTVIDNPPE